MNRPRRYAYEPRTLALYTLYGHVGGALVLGLPASTVGSPFGLWAVFAWAALGGGTGAFIGLILLRVDATDDPPEARRPPTRPWVMIAVGALVSVVVTVVSLFVNFRTGGFLDGSPCFGQRTETLVPLQYTCLDPDGAVALVLPETVALTLLSLFGAATITWGLVAVRRTSGDIALGRLDRIALYLGWAVAVFLMVNGVLGMAAVIEAVAR